ncbi:hypothetical protein O6H91_13G040000 [Diphasiastrum complanatum]|uniref:Uncharacterized protein n=1 Tax=Diphasiastrum complanatum TaxID=34168 RepID=A0ACC2BV54_DIPCM|nr:hypothetical protein O6H91_13G040000 [Diphasiastrum complanatum]
MEKLPVLICVLMMTLSSLLSFTHGLTDPQDVSAIGVLYASLNSPQLTGWKGSGGGDPCGESWVGVTCTGSSITSIKLPGRNLGGSLGYALDKFASLVTLDLSNNQIGHSFPYQMPPVIQELYLNNNQLTGGLPYSFTSLSTLTHLNLGNNQLHTQISDVLQSLVNLLSMDLSNNELIGKLPQSFTSLKSLNTLNLENNQLTGNIDVLGHLPLQNVDIQNNQFSGWIPSNLLNIPNLRSGGNQFSTSPAPPSPPFTNAPPSPLQGSGNGSNSGSHSPPSATGQGQSKNFWTGGKIAGIAVACLLGLVAAGLILAFLLWKKRAETDDEEKQVERTSWLAPAVAPVKGPQWEKSEKKLRDSPENVLLKPPPFEKSKLQGERSPVKSGSNKSIKISMAATTFSVADLQVATSSFGQENLIGEGSLGRVYRGELQTGKLVAVKKIDSSAPPVQNEDEFLGIVSTIARLRHANVLELVGHCTEHGQRLLVYDYMHKGTLYDILHSSDDKIKKLSWNQRVKIAMGAARALEYLHEVCLPTIVHKNFKSANILLDEEMNPHLSDCGIAALTSYGSERQVSAQILGSFGYSAPEYAMSGTYTAKSDVYSFGVVMLELLTGRKPLDSSRKRSQQSLVRWATPQLHDIDALSRMVDPALKGIYPAKSLSRFADIISLCVQPEPEFRPPMSEVVQALVRLMQRASLSKRRLISRLA